MNFPEKLELLERLITDFKANDDNLDLRFYKDVLEHKRVVVDWNAGQHMSFYEDAEKAVEYFLGQFKSIIDKKDWNSKKHLLIVSEVWLLGFKTGLREGANHK